MDKIAFICDYSFVDYILFYIVYCLYVYIVWDNKTLMLGDMFVLRSRCIVKFRCPYCGVGTKDFTVELLTGFEVVLSFLLGFGYAFYVFVLK